MKLLKPKVKLSSSILQFPPDQTKWLPTMIWLKGLFRGTRINLYPLCAAELYPHLRDSSEPSNPSVTLFTIQIPLPPSLYPDDKGYQRCSRL
jgi:hypothetical protein